MLINENQLDNWVRANAQQARGIVPELVARLTAAAAPNAIKWRFPLADAIGQHGSDGFLNVDVEYRPYIPLGKSQWEIGTSAKTRAKATRDYKIKTASVPKAERSDQTFIFVTPLSGMSDWEYTWKKAGIEKWINDRVNRCDWKDVRVYDGAMVVGWLDRFPAVEDWLAQKMNLSLGGVQGVDRYWKNLRITGEPPLLGPDVFLTNRVNVQERLKNLIDGDQNLLKLETRWPRHAAANFVSAYVGGLTGERYLEVAGRCVVVSKEESWPLVVQVHRPHILVIDFNFDEADGTSLLNAARQGGHQVVYAGSPGGLSTPARMALNDPKPYQLQEALEKSGYVRERARGMAERSGGRLAVLLRLVV